MSGAAFKDHFSAKSDAYAKYRPSYPAELFAWLATLAPERARAWDCATGNGQAALGLAQHFAHVIATDASDRQLAHATPHERIEYRVAAAESSGLDAGSVDLVTVAQAAHWFDLDRFYAEARRVLRPDGAIVVWAYSVCAIEPAVDRVVGRFYRDVVGPYWPPERGAVDDHYRSFPFPFPEVDRVPEFAMENEWSLDDFLGYLGTWSATQGFVRAKGFDPLPALRAELAEPWGESSTTRRVRWPLHIRAGHGPR